MKTVLVIYATTSGNTQNIAEKLQAQFKAGQVTVQIKDVTAAKLQDIIGPQDLILFGCPSYGVDDIELQEDFAQYFEQWDGTDMSGKKYAVFAPGDSAHEHFCGAVGVIEDKIRKLGGTLVVEGLKIDGDPDDFDDDINAWASDVMKAVS